MNTTDTSSFDEDSSALINPLTVAKTIAMLVLGLGSFALGLAPLKLTRWWRTESYSPTPPTSDPHQHQHQHPGEAASGSRTVSLLLCFGGGVLLCTTLLHLQPEVREEVDRLQHAGRLPDYEMLDEILFCAGFFMVFVVDEIAHSVLDLICASGRRVHDAGEDAVRRSMSLRRRSEQTVPQDESSSVSVSSFMSHGEKGEQPERRRESQESVQDESTESQQQRNRDELDVEKQRVSGDDDDQPLRGLFTVLALSLHEVFEGLALGLESNRYHVWYLFAAVATHKLVIAFCIGMELAWSNTRRAVVVAYVATFALVTPVGIACGMIITSSGTAAVDGQPGPVAVVLQGLAAGTLLYVVFLEILSRHRRSGWPHLLAIMIGFGMLLALQTLTHHHHGHGHGDNHDHGHGHNIYHGLDCGHNQGNDHGHDNGHDHRHYHGHDHGGHDHDHGHDHGGHDHDHAHSD